MNEPSDMPTNITADELFERVSDILNVKTPSEMTNRQMHETLLLCCAEGLRDTRHGFGNLSSQVDSLCKRHHVKPADTAAIQKMRRDSESHTPRRSALRLPRTLPFHCRRLRNQYSFNHHRQDSSDGQTCNRRKFYRLYIYKVYRPVME